MRILFVGKAHLPLIGGVQLTTHYLARELGRRGHEVAVLGLRRPQDPGCDHDERFGYLTERSPVPERRVGALLERFRPDTVMVSGNEYGRPHVAHALLKQTRSLPTALYVHDLESTELANDPEVRVDGVAAVSRFVAQRVSRPPAPVLLPPIVDRRLYDVPSNRRTVLFVNPRRSKGLEVALGLARSRPDIPFDFVRSWPLSSNALGALRTTVRGLPNVSLRGPVQSPAALYGTARVALVPSREPEGWGRVAAEAQASGIPVLASAVGGLRETVGGGGIVVDSPADLRPWLDALSQIWDDELAYAGYAALARRNAKRSELTPEYVGDAFEALASRLSASGPSRRNALGSHPPASWPTVIHHA